MSSLFWVFLWLFLLKVHGLDRTGMATYGHGMEDSTAVLQRAAEVLRQRGWMPHRRHQAECAPGGPVCIYAALLLACGIDVADWAGKRNGPAWPALANEAGNRISTTLGVPRVLGVSDWEGQPGRTAEQALAAVVAAARPAA